MAAVLHPAWETHARLSRLRGFESGAREIDDAAVEVEGHLPDWLRGRLLLNGPALWELPGGHFDHWFDGLGMWHRLHLGDDGVRYRSRFAQSDAYNRTMRSGSPAYGEFGSRNPAPLLARIKGVQATDNPAVVMSRLGSGAGARWISVTETPFLTVFDPDSLATLERIDLVDTPEHLHLMSAHGIAARDGSWWNVGITLGPRCDLKLFRVAPGGRAAEVRARIRVAKAGYTHAFAMAEGHAIVWETALRVQPLSMRFSSRAYSDNFRWEPAAGSMLHAISLSDGTVRSWAIPPMMCFHAVQAYADGDDLVLELCEFETPQIFSGLRLAERRAGRPLPLPRLVRYRMSRGRGEAEREVIGEGIELPQVHPLRVGAGRAAVAFAAGMDPGSPFFDRTVRIDLDSGERREWRRAHAVQLEPLLVPRPGATAHDDGVLLVPTLADTDVASVVAVLDAHSLEPLAMLHAPQVVPFGFHAAWDG
ncbi:carotenoid oxygenase family protein [Caldimonas sp. KR1-144]|uniref:carotenoid oxygenase family protein n=1 Tax=Caldimonas sp. KR1-144 TaxID=3400911 RepID=UPI003BFF0845